MDVTPLTTSTVGDGQYERCSVLCIMSIESGHCAMLTCLSFFPLTSCARLLHAPNTTTAATILRATQTVDRFFWVRDGFLALL